MNKFFIKILVLIIIINSCIVKVHAEPQSEAKKLIELAQKASKKDIDKAIEYAKKALKQANVKDQEYTECYILLGELFNKKRKYDLAIKYLQMAKILYDSSSDNYENIDRVYYLLAKNYSNQNIYDSTLNYLNKIFLHNQYKQYKWFIDILELKGKTFYLLSDMESAASVYKEAIILADSDSKDKALMYNRLSAINRRMGEFEKSIQNSKNALDIQLKNKDSLGMAESYYGLGSVHYYLAEYDITLNYFQRALNIFDTYKMLKDQVRLNNNIGSVYNEMKEYDLALKYFKKSLKQYKELESAYAIAIVNDNIGIAYQGLGDFDKAEAYYKKSLKMQIEVNNPEGQINALINIAGLYKVKKQLKTAHKKFLELLERAKQTKLINEQLNIYKNLVEIEEEIGLYKKALQSYKAYGAIKDTLFSRNSKEQLNKLQTEFDVRENQSKIKLLQTENKLKEEQINKQKLFSITISVIVLLMLVLLTFSLLALKISRSAKRKLEEQNHKINEQNKRITDSIDYARQMQFSLLKTSDELESAFKNNFIISQAKDIVSGDFWWLKTINNKQYLIVADCTGHGVPGGFMSVLGITIINNIINKNKILEPNLILNELRNEVKALLVQDGILGNFDSIDLMLCVIDKQNMNMEYSGAYNYAYILRDKNIIEVRGDKMPISFSLKEKSFEKNTIQLKSGDRLFMLSDGYVDQFDEKDEKITRKRLKEILIQTSEVRISEQGVFLKDFFHAWKKNQEQTDDMLVLGVEI